MKFEEALKYLREGKKIRRKDWNDKIYITLEEGDIYINTYDCCSWPFYGTIEFYSLITDNWELYKEPILTEAERNYLKAVIKPFRDKVRCIKKVGDGKFQKIAFRINDIGDDFKLPYFDTNDMYINMETDKEYTLKELEL